ncbi:MAG: response regulator [Planctomycetota bacterium]
MRLEALSAEVVRQAIGIYQEIAYGTAGRARRAATPLDDAALDGADHERLLALFTKERVEAVPGRSCVRYSLRLGNRNYPFMKLVLQEHLLAGEFFFAVDTHDQMEIKPDFPDYEAWMAVRRFNRDLKAQIEDAFDHKGLETSACLRRVVEARGGCAATAAPQAGQDRGTILIVDDEVDLACTVELLLQARGFRTVTIHDGGCAARTVAELLPRLVLLDYELPEMDGLQVIAQLRSNPVTQGIPVVLSSAAHVSMDDIRRADAFLAKPFQEDLLYEIVERMLQKGEVRK